MIPVLKKKTFAAALILLALAAPLAFAAPQVYVKGALGYGYRTRDWHRAYSYDMGDFGSGSTEYKFEATAHAFVATPAIGVAPWRKGENPLLRGLSFEASLEAGFGPLSIEYAGLDFEIDALAIALNPKVMAVYSCRAGKVVPYGAAGFSVPVVIVPEFAKSPHTYSRESGGVSFGYKTAVAKAAFSVNLAAGAGFAVFERFMPFAEVDFGFGFGLGASVDARAGVAYRFGGSSW